MVLLVGLICVSGVRAAEIRPVDLRAARDGDGTIFQVRIPMPDARNVVLMPSFGRGSASPREGHLSMPQLVGTPVAETPCYVLFDEVRSAWEPQQARDVFIGRTRQTGSVPLTLFYRTKSEGWTSHSLTLDLSSAEPMKAASRQVRLNDRNTTTVEASPRQQFLLAEADWMGAAGAPLGDPLGFWAYARLQRLREAGLPMGRADRENNFNRFRRAELYDLATGARAIQESLQLERMLDGATTTEPRTIAIGDLEGITVAPLPYEKLRAGREPRFSPSAGMVPADQWYLRFGNLAKLQELADLAQDWSGALSSSPEIGDAEHGLRARLQNQMCLPSALLSRVLGPAVVSEIVITGSDPFLREGTDLTAIFTLKSPDLFRAGVSPYWKAAEAAGARPVETGMKDVESLVTPDRSVSAYRTFVGETAIYSNSLPALRRVLDLARDPKSSASLAQSPDFRYQRAEWPEDPENEDGFLFLSDPFIRRLSGPEVRIKEKRRLEAMAGLRQVHNAAMLHGYLHGPGALVGLPQLLKAGLLRPQDLKLPDGAPITWDAATATAASDVWGNLRFMTPLAEGPIDKVSASERVEYNAYRTSYQQFWQRFFDPIAIRTKIGKTVSFDVHIAPLIELSGYNELKRYAGEKPGTFDLATVTTSTLMRWQVCLDPNGRELRQMREMAGGMVGAGSVLTDWIGDWAALWLEDGPSLAAAAPLAAREMGLMSGGNDGDDEVDASGGLSDIFAVPLGVAVESKNPISLASFLVTLQGMVNTSAPNTVRFIPQEPYRGSTFVKVAPVEGGDLARELARDKQRNPGASADAKTTEPSFWYGTIGQAWTVSLQESVLKHTVDALEAARDSNTSRPIEYAAFVLLSPGNAHHAKPLIDLAAKAYTRSAERRALQDAWLLWRCGLVAKGGDDVTSASRAFLGGALTLPSGGQIGFDPAGAQAVSSKLGPMRDLKPMAAMGDDIPVLGLAKTINHLRAWLRFTEEGLLTRIELERP
ncbi:hypothetical protein CVU37_14525 [candidate division BRC1 bacterium HGW-BRC1-1]|jgi:hypothetical protein|nr:MAG: hypothetical protein CVU37_14525 [candidate division BRC1 bacterium HGW-BRC1-1]